MRATQFCPPHSSKRFGPFRQGRPKPGCLDLFQGSFHPCLGTNTSLETESGSLEKQSGLSKGKVTKGCVKPPTQSPLSYDQGLRVGLDMLTERVKGNQDAFQKLPWASFGLDPRPMRPLGTADPFEKCHYHLPPPLPRQEEA